MAQHIVNSIVRYPLKLNYNEIDYNTSLHQILLETDFNCIHRDVWTFEFEKLIEHYLIDSNDDLYPLISTFLNFII